MESRGYLACLWIILLRAAIDSGIVGDLVLYDLLAWKGNPV